MGLAHTLKTNSIFESLPEHELASLYGQIYNQSATMVGRCADGSVIVFRPSVRKGGALLFLGNYRTNAKSEKIEEPIEATFSFVLNESKYLFKAQFHRRDRRRGELHLLTLLYRIQRRSVKRLRIPSDYYAVVRFSHQNNRLIRVFGKMMDISPRGMGIFLPKVDHKLKVGDHLRVVLNVSHRPPESIDLRLIHIRPMANKEGPSSEKTEGLFFGAVFLPEHSITIFKRMNAVVTDIYRDLFGAMAEDSKKI